MKTISITELQKTIFSTIGNMKNGEKISVIKNSKVVATITKKED